MALNKGFSNLLPFLFLFLSIILSALPYNGAKGAAKNKYAGTELPGLIRQRLEHLNTHYPQEKLYIHTDKSHYVLGETVWFRVYLSDAQTHLYSPYSSVAYVELSDTLGNWSERHYIYLEDSKGHGDFLLDTDMDPGSYVMRAYTNYMRNFDSSFIYSKEIRIWNPFREDPLSGEDWGESATVSAGDFEQSTRTRTRGASFEDFHVQFFPEGGDLVSGMSSLVAVKATDTKGTGINIDGIIYDNENRQVGDFSTKGFGMGVFVIMPRSDAGCYLEVNHDGMTRRFSLPEVKARGYSMMVDNRGENSAVVRVATNIPGGLENAVLAGHVRGELFCLVGLGGGEHALIEVDKSGFPAGVAHFTLFTGEGMPVAERLVFIGNRNPEATLEVAANSNGYKKREKVEIELDLRDADSNPLTGDFSISVTDSYVVPSLHERHNIETYLLLASDLPGYIEDPGYFFDSQNQDGDELLDLLMLTHGWRRFRWSDLLSGSYPDIRHMAEKSYGVSGVVTRKDPPALPVRSRVLLTAIGPDFVADEVITGEDGRFYFDDLDLYDTTYVVVQASIYRERRAQRRERRGIDESFQLSRDNWVSVYLDDADFTGRGYDIPAASYTRSVMRGYISDAMKDPDISSMGDIWRLDLDTVVIRGRRQRERTTFDRASAHGEPMWGKRLVADSIGAEYFNSVLDMIQSKVPGAQVYPDRITFRYVDFHDLGVCALILLNNTEVDFSTLQSLSVHDISFIDVMSSVDAFVYGHRAVAGAIAIYTKTGEELRNRKPDPRGIVGFRYPGYHRAREFYAPVYDIPKPQHARDDYRTTLYWNPEVTIPEDGKARVQFYTSDKASVYRVVVEGLTKTGIPIAATGEITVQDDPIRGYE